MVKGRGGLLACVVLIFIALTQPVFASSSIQEVVAADGDINWADDVDTSSGDIDMYTSGHKTKGIFEFDLSGIPDDITILYASLNLSVSRFEGIFAPTTINFYGSSGDGIVSLEDYTNTTCLLSSVTYISGSLPKVGDSLSVALDVDLVNEILSDPDSAYLTIVAVIQQAFGWVGFASLENTKGYEAASLTITYEQKLAPVPVPSSALCLASALAGLFILRRWKLS